MTAPATPKGVVAVLTGPDGSAYSSLSDFDASGYGGFTLREAQELRLKHAIARDLVNGCCAGFIAKAMDAMDCDRVLRKLTSDHGFTLTFIPIGHDDEEAP